MVSKTPSQIDNFLGNSEEEFATDSNQTIFLDRPQIHEIDIFEVDDDHICSVIDLTTTPDKKIDYFERYAYYIRCN